MRWWRQKRKLGRWPRRRNQSVPGRRESSVCFFPARTQRKRSRLFDSRLPAGLASDRPPLMRSRCKLFILLLLVFSRAGAYAAAIPVQAPRAMVASVHRLASRAGVQMMKAGGNAVDAAVAVGFALAVVYPQAGNLGGGGFMLIRSSDGRTHFIDYREKAPAAATANMYLDAKGNVIEDASTVGYKAIGVPGSVAGMVYAEQKYGKLSLERVMAPAIKLAQEGFVLAEGDARDLRDEDEKVLARFPESKRIFQRDGNYYKAGEVLKQPEL